MDPLTTALISILGSGTVAGGLIKIYHEHVKSRFAAEAAQRADEAKALEELQGERRESQTAFVHYLQAQVSEQSKTGSAMVGAMAGITQSLDSITKTQTELLAELRELKGKSICHAPKRAARSKV